MLLNHSWLLSMPEYQQVIHRLNYQTYKQVIYSLKGKEFNHKNRPTKSYIQFNIIYIMRRYSSTERGVEATLRIGQTQTRTNDKTPSEGLKIKQATGGAGRHEACLHAPCLVAFVLLNDTKNEI